MTITADIPGHQPERQSELHGDEFFEARVRADVAEAQAAGITDEKILRMIQRESEKHIASLRADAQQRQRALVQRGIVKNARRSRRSSPTGI